jgi:hypothetical protein
MHDPQYRAEVARQNTAYNQPSYTSFYLASDTNWANVPLNVYWTPGVLSVIEKKVAEYKVNGELTGPIVPQLENSLKMAQFHLEKGSVDQALTFMDKFTSELNKKVNQSYLSSNAKLNLSHDAEEMIDMLEKVEKK